MFTWICPKCGKEVPPHENECPYCHGTGKVDEPAGAKQPGSLPTPPEQRRAPYVQQPHQATPPPPPQPAPYVQQPQQPTPYQAPPPPPPQQQYDAPPPAPPQQAPPNYPPPPAQQSYAPSPAPPPQSEQQYYELGGNTRRGLPGWAVMILVALVAVGLGYVLYEYVLPSNQSSSAAGKGTAFEEVGEVKPSAEAARIARHIEATGFRISEDSQQRAEVQYLIINHSAADIGNLAGFVNLRVRDAGKEDPPIFRIEFEAEKLGPYESKEFKTVLKTELRAYEIPDWQFLRGDVEITSPTSSE